MENSNPVLFPVKIWWYLAIVAVGGIVALVQPLVGLLVFTVGFIGVVAVSAPVGIALYILLAPFPLGIIFHHHKFYVSDLMAILLAIWLLVRSWRGGGLRSAWNTFMVKEYRNPLILVLALSVLSLAVTLSRIGTTVKILEYIEFFVVMVALVRYTTFKAPQVRNFYVKVLAFTVSLVTLDGLYQFMFQLGPAVNIVDVHHVRAVAFFGQPNVFGAFNDMTFPLLLALIVFGAPELPKRWLTAALVIEALGVVISYSRGSWVADAAAVFFMGLVVWGTKGKAFLGKFALYGIAIPVAMFLVTMGLGKIDLSHTAVASAYHKNTLERIRTSVTAIFHPATHFDTNQRLLIWKSAFEAIKTHPLLGVGLGNFHLFIAAHPPKGLAAVPPMAHNFYLEWGADLGIGGIIAGLWYQWTWIKTVWNLMRQRAQALSGETYAWVLGGFGTFVAFIVHNWVDFMIDHGVIVPLLLVLGIVAAIATEIRAEKA